MRRPRLPLLWGHPWLCFYHLWEHREGLPQSGCNLQSVSSKLPAMHRHHPGLSVARCFICWAPSCSWCLLRQLQHEPPLEACFRCFYARTTTPENSARLISWYSVPPHLAASLTQGAAASTEEQARLTEYSLGHQARLDSLHSVEEDDFVDPRPDHDPTAGSSERDCP